MIGYYAEVTPAGRYVQCHIVELPQQGTLEPAHQGNALVPVNTPPASWEGPTPTAVLHLVDGAEQWIETVSLSEFVSQTRARIDGKADAARQSVLVTETKDLEYTRAREVAQPFKDGGYLPPAPEAVQSWADAKKWRNGGVPWTAQRAADDILAQAGQYAYLLDSIRRLRLDAMEHCLAVGEDPAGTHAQVAAIEAQFNADLATLMGMP